MDAAQEKQNKLIGSLRALGRAAVAFSGGTDSAFLLRMAQEALGSGLLAVTGRFVSFPEREAREAERFCASLGVAQVFADFDQLAVPGLRENPADRCYLCKKALFSAFQEAARERGFFVLLEGSNADDAQGYRPGLRAVAELGIRSPLRDAGLTKAEIRALSEELGLPQRNKPSSACLATRFPYGETLTEERIRAVGAA